MIDFTEPLVTLAPAASKINLIFFWLPSFFFHIIQASAVYNNEALMKKRIIIAVICAVFTASISTLSAMTGDEAVARFKSRFYSISTMKGVINITSSTGMMITGSFKYMAPGKFQIKLSAPSGKIITTNGRKLWVYDSSSNVCGVQDVGGVSGGVAGLLGGYMAIASQSGSDTTIKLKSATSYYRDIAIQVDGSYMLKKVAFRDDKGNGFTAVLSGVTINEPIASGTFDFNAPSNAQVVKNPLNIR